MGEISLDFIPSKKTISLSFERKRAFSASTFNCVMLWRPTNSTTPSKITQLIVIALKGESLTLLYALIKSCSEIQNFLSFSTHQVFICVRLHSVIFQCWLKNLGGTPQGVYLLVIHARGWKSQTVQGEHFFGRLLIMGQRMISHMQRACAKETPFETRDKRCRLGHVLR